MKKMWAGLFLMALVSGMAGYTEQGIHGLAATGLTDQIPWGLYISQFVFFVGIAASAVILVIPALTLQRQEAHALLRVGKALALAAVVTSLLFVTADLGRPARIWHALPGIGLFNFPASIIAWDFLALISYLILTAFLLARPGGHWGLILAVILGIGIHTITAFLLAGHPARPFWHTGVLAPRFLASAFASGASLMLLLAPRWPPETGPWGRHYLRWVVLACLSVDLFLLGSEGFVWFYQASAEGESGRWLYGGGLGMWSLWAWLGVGLKGVALATVWFFSRGYGVALLGLWMEKGLGLIVPGFMPTPLGEHAPYWPTQVEIQVTLGILGLGAYLFLLLLGKQVSRTHPP